MRHFLVSFSLMISESHYLVVAELNVWKKSVGDDDDAVGMKQLESAVLHCLSLLDLALQKEVLFMDLLRESQASLLVSPLEQLLQGVNAQSRRADHIINIAR